MISTSTASATLRWRTSAPTWVASRDLNGDGIDDLVTANKGQDNVSVLLSSGGGSFASHVEYAAGNGADAVVVDDFDVDGKRDLAVADFSSDVISILPGASTAGTFTGCANNTPSCEYIAGDGPVSLVTGALNADTYPDLAVVDQNSGSVTILLNAYVPPTPTFTPTPCTGTCPTPTPTCSGSCGGC